MSLSRFVLSAILTAIAFPAVAEVQPHALFDHSMVLQQGVRLPVWGLAEPGEEVYVHLEIRTADGKREEGQSVKADDQGRWQATLAPFPVGTDGTLTIRGAAGKIDPKGKKAPNERVFKDVAVGEVWVCSGQSNMEWSLAACPRGGGPEAIANSKNPMLRVFTVSRYAHPEPQSTFNPRPISPKHHKWLLSDPDNAPMFSAVAYYFGQKLQQTLQVPIGIIHTSWSGTPAEAWTSREALLKDPALKYYIEGLDTRRKAFDPEQAEAQYKKALEKWEQAATDAKQNNKKQPPRPAAPRAPGFAQNDGASLYNGMIAPLLPYAIRGAIWYQGESNAGKPIEYRTLFAAMIEDWRKRWAADLPFYCVQLAPFHAGNPNGENWAFLREAQALACEKVHNAGVAVITDVGELNDIHPQQKKPVGERLAFLALANTYQQKIPSQGPLFKAKKAEKSELVLTFESVSGELKIGQFSMPGAEDVGKDGKLVGFEIAGADGKFHPAAARIEGSTVVLTSEAVPEPVHARYGWKNFCVGNLFNSAGIPASPFRTDEALPPGLK